MNSIRQTKSAIIAVLICVAAAVLVFGRKPTPTLPVRLPDPAESMVNLRGKTSLSIAGQPAPPDNPIPDAGEPIDWTAIERERSREQEQASVRSIPVSRAPRPELDDVRENTAAQAVIVAPRPVAAARLEPSIRYHRIVEGDTLRDLAGRYLGSPDRYLELFYANRSVLPHPDVLPLHARIVIPEKTDPMASTVNPGDAAEARAASPWSSRPLPPDGIRLPEIASPP